MIVALRITPSNFVCTTNNWSARKYMGYIQRDGPTTAVPRNSARSSSPQNIGVSNVSGSAAGT